MTEQAAQEPTERPARPRSRAERLAEHAARHVTDWAGSTWAFVLAMLVVVVWLASGPVFHYSETWQLVINTGTTIITFLMVFLIQRAQNKDARAVQLKLNELVASMKGASNRLIDIEDLDESDLETLHKHYSHLARLAKEERDVGVSHSVEEAMSRHRRKTEDANG